MKKAFRLHQEFRLKNTDEIWNKKHKKVCRGLIHHLLIIITGCVSSSAFASLVAIPLVASSAVGLKSCAITVWFKKYKPINSKKKKDKIVLLGNFKLNRIEVLLSEALIDSNISH